MNSVVSIDLERDLQPADAARKSSSSSASIVKVGQSGEVVPTLINDIDVSVSVVVCPSLPLARGAGELRGVFLTVRKPFINFDATFRTEFLPVEGSLRIDPEDCRREHILPILPLIGFAIAVTFGVTGACGFSVT